MIDAFWVDIDVGVGFFNQKPTDALFASLYNKCCEYKMSNSDVSCWQMQETSLHHVRKQERLEQMQLVLQKQLWDAPLKTVVGRPTKNSWDG